MSIKRLRWLLTIVIAELLIVIGVMVWAVVKDDGALTETPDYAASGSVTLKPSLLATGFDAPTVIAHTGMAGDDRLFIGERKGVVKILQGGTPSDSPFLDISSKVKDNGGEMGFLSLTFHPRFSQNGFFYVNYIDKDEHTIISRFTASSNSAADPASEKVLIKLKQPYQNHNGGTLVFGKDSYLYISLGDGGSAGDPQNRAQDKSSFFGKILRIDVDRGDPYSVPADNPFVREAGAKPEIWALGLRNPWRMSFDRQTGDLFIGDVGQNTYEEINLQPGNSKGGENYGWRCFEGLYDFKTDGCQAAEHYVSPILEYDHSGDKCSVTGGHVYRGTEQPVLFGKYVYADLCGVLFVAEPQNGSWVNVATLNTPYYMSTFGEDATGELYLAELHSGSIYKLEAR